MDLDFNAWFMRLNGRPALQATNPHCESNNPWLAVFAFPPQATRTLSHLVPKPPAAHGCSSFFGPENRTVVFPFSFLKLPKVAVSLETASRLQPLNRKSSDLCNKHCQARSALFVPMAIGGLCGLCWFLRRNMKQDSALGNPPCRRSRFGFHVNLIFLLVKSR